MSYLLEITEACKTCYEISSRICTRQSSGPCPHCGKWTSITVAREVKSDKPSNWNVIRPRPKIRPDIDYQLCTRQKRCRNGKLCSFPHSELEQKVWTKQRAEEEPRLLPFHHNQLCKIMLNGGLCRVFCPYAHSTTELQHWERMPIPSFIRPAPRIQPHLDYQMCRHFLKGHICPKNESCKFAHGYDELAEWQKSMPKIRSAPLLPLGVPGYRLCKLVKNGYRCLHGPGCKFAHSILELNEWNSLLHQRKLQSQDFASRIRELVSCKFTRENTLPQDMSNRVRINEVSNKKLDIQCVQPPSDMCWDFSISNTSEEGDAILESIILYDVLSAEFTIQEVYSQYDGRKVQVPTKSKAREGVGCSLHYEMFPREEIHVKILLKPHLGIQAQLVIFHFDHDFYLARALCVQITNKIEALSSEKHSTCRTRPESPRIKLREQTDNISALMIQQQCEKADSALPPYTESLKPVSEEEIDILTKNSISEENYRDRMTILLRVEEQQQNDNLDRYGLYSMNLRITKTYTTLSQGQMYAPEGFYYIEVALDDVLYEGGRSIRRGDGAHLKAKGSCVVHECYVVDVHRESVILLITQKAKDECDATAGICTVEFFLPRIQFRAMTYATKIVELDVIFPKVLPENIISLSQAPHLQNCLDEIPQLQQLYDDQKQALEGMLHPELKHIPSLVLGPFGCGKTYVMTKCIQLLAQHTNEKILVCTHSNSAADHFVRTIVSTSPGRKIGSLLRLYFTFRQISTVPRDIQQYCKIEDGQFVIPQLAEIKEYQIIVSTLIQSRVLKLLGVEAGHFSYIFIDEAAQALEPESLIPLTLASKNTKTVLAGDHLQVGPPVYSSVAEAHGLRTSLLERLYDHKVYNTGDGQSCKTLLSENHRSHHKILEIPSKLFYQTPLTSKAKFPSNGPKDESHIGFIGIDGQEMQDEDSPSFYNVEEAIKIVEWVCNFVNKGLDEADICVLATYSKQVKKMREVLRKYGKLRVTVTRVDGVEGQEFRAVFLSTVRTCFSKPDLGEQDPFLNNPKFMNTAITRAKEWLFVVGEPITLCTVGENSHCWLKFIKICQSSEGFWYEGTHLGNDSGQVKYLLENKSISRQIITRLQAKSSKMTDAVTETDSVNYSAANGSSSKSIESASEKLSPSEDNTASVQPSNTALSSPKTSDQHHFPEAPMHLKPPIKNVTLTNEIIGHGSYGCVEVVKIRDVEYAAKRFHRDFERQLKYKLNKKLIMEYTILISLKHKNVVNYLGLSYVHNEGLPILIMEKLICSLHDRLCHDQSPPVFPTKLRILLDVAEGLCYLHGQEPAVIHRDLTARNVLLDSQGLAKISDFGNSTIIQIDQMSTLESMTCTPGTIVYSAPESMQHHKKYNEKIDIFSFGHLALFVFINEFPSELLAPVDAQEDGTLLARSEVQRRQRYIDILKMCAENHREGAQGCDIYKLVIDCLENRPQNRPPAVELTKFFHNHPLLDSKHDPKLVERVPISGSNTSDSSSAHIN